MKRLVSFFTFLILCNQLIAQRCGSQQLLEQNPDAVQKLEQLNEANRLWLNDHSGVERSIVTIPVVVHVVYNTPVQNISDDQIKSQIEVLNEDFRRLNIDTVNTPEIYQPLGADSEIEFCLAATDPDGNPTSGITRTSTDVTAFSVSDDVKQTDSGGADGWDGNSYLNIWVCNLADDVLGYATYPGSTTPEFDGVVILFHAFGREGFVVSPYDQGRTCTHEIGHWLGLRHIWADDGGTCSGTDNIDDTPNQASEHYGCPSFPQYSCGNTGDMHMNYMDYTDDDCMNIFTIGQADYMIATLNTDRPTILQSTAGCQSLVTLNLDAAVTSIAVPYDTVSALSFPPQIVIQNKGFTTITNLHIVYQVDGQDIQEYDYSGNLVSLQSELITLPLAFTGEGGHVFTVYCMNPNGGTDEKLSNDTLTNEFTVVSTIPKNTIVIYPNPTHESVTINIQNPSSGEMVLYVCNGLGQIAAQQFIPLATESTFQLDLSNYPNGMYFLYALIGYDQASEKIMLLR